MSGWVWVGIFVLWMASIVVAILIVKGGNGDADDRMSDAWIERKRREREK